MHIKVSSSALFATALLSGCLNIDNNIPLREPVLPPDAAMDEDIDAGSEPEVDAGDVDASEPPNEPPACAFGATDCLPKRDGVCDPGENAWHEPGVCPRVIELESASSISANARYVAGAPYSRSEHIFAPGVLDLGTNQFKRLPRDSLGALVESLTMSPDGRLVAFSADSGGGPDDTNNALDVFVYDLMEERLRAVSTNAAGLFGNGSSGSPSFSRDGATLFFLSDATNLEANGQAGLYAFDLKSATLRSVLAGEITMFEASDDGSTVVHWVKDVVSLVKAGATEPPILIPGYSSNAVSASGETAALCYGDGLSLWKAPFANVTPLLSGACRDVSFAGFSEHIVMVNDESPLVPEDINNRRDIYALDLDTAKAVRVSVNDQGRELTRHSYLKDVSADGQFLFSQVDDAQRYGRSARLTFIGDLIDVD